MAEAKTKQTEESVQAYLDAIDNETQRKDAAAIAKLMKQVSKREPKMWGPAIIGFAGYHYKYESGHEGDAPAIGFSARKGKISVYVMGAIVSRPDLLKKLGKHKAGKGCLYITKLEDVDTAVLKEIIAFAFDYLKNKVKETPGWRLL